MGRAAEKARAKNYVSLAVDERGKHQRILGGIVFEIGVLNDDVVAADQLDFHRDCQDLEDHLAERGALVINGHDDGKFHGASAGRQLDQDDCKSGICGWVLQAWLSRELPGKCLYYQQVTRLPLWEFSSIDKLVGRGILCQRCRYPLPTETRVEPGFSGQ